MQTVILAGGLGTRLKPMVHDRPKPMAPILGKPFLEYQFSALKRAGSSRLVLCVGYGSRWIEEYFGDGSNWGLEICYSKESTPLGTAGALRHAERLLDSRFQVLNGDTYLEIDVTRMFEWHCEKQSIATLAIAESNDPRAYGNVALNSIGRILSFSEKTANPESGENPRISAGHYIFERRILDHIAPGRPVSLEQEIFPLLLARGEPLFGFAASGYFIDIGTPESYSRFERDIKEGRVHVDSE